MKDFFQRWLAKLPKANGLRACGIRFGDRECVSRSLAGELTADKLRDILESLSEIAPAFATRGATGQRQRWVFDRACLHVAVRPDGVMLAVVTTPEADAGATLGLLENFSGLVPA